MKLRLETAILIATPLKASNIELHFVAIHNSYVKHFTCFPFFKEQKQKFFDKPEDSLFHLYDSFIIETTKFIVIIASLQAS